jgi:hypothetical protein
MVKKNKPVDPVKAVKADPEVHTPESQPKKLVKKHSVRSDPTEQAWKSGVSIPLAADQSKK